MKLLWISFLLFFIGSDPITDHWQVSSDSKIIISGSSNVNSFKCILSEYSMGEELITDEDERGFVFSRGTISLEIEKFDCGHNIMNKDFYATLQSDKYPTITLILTKILLKTEINGFGIFEVIIGGQKKENVIIDLEVFKTNYGLELSGSKRFYMSEFGIEPPTKFFGVVQVNDIIEIDFDLRMAKLLN